MSMRHGLAVATRPDVVRRSLGVAAVVGTMLVAINHFEKIVSLEIAGADVVKIVLTYLVPYGVSTYASVMHVLHEHGAPTRS